MKFDAFNTAKGKFIQSTGYQPDHCRIHPDDGAELIATAGAAGREDKGGKFAMVAGVPVLLDEAVEKGKAVFEVRERLPYEPPPAWQKPKPKRRS